MRSYQSINKLALNAKNEAALPVNQELSFEVIPKIPVSVDMYNTVLF